MLSRIKRTQTIQSNFILHRLINLILTREMVTGNHVFILLFQGVYLYQCVTLRMGTSQFQFGVHVFSICVSLEMETSQFHFWVHACFSFICVSLEMELSTSSSGPCMYLCCQLESVDAKSMSQQQFPSPKTHIQKKYGLQK